MGFYFYAASRPPPPPLSVRPLPPSSVALVAVNYLTYRLTSVNLSLSIPVSFVFCGKCDTLSVRGEGCKSSSTHGDVLLRALVLK